MSKRAELQKTFDDRLDTAFGHFRFNRYGRFAIAAVPLTVAGAKLTANKITVPPGSLDTIEASAALKREVQTEDSLMEVLQMPTQTPAAGFGLSVLYSRWRQGRLARQTSLEPDPSAPVMFSVPDQSPVLQTLPETHYEEQEIAV